MFVGADACMRPRVDASIDLYSNATLPPPAPFVQTAQGAGGGFFV